jgi:hypothetical protein
VTSTDHLTTTPHLTARNLAPAPSGVTTVQLTPKKVLALILGLGLPVAISAGWALGQRDAAAGETTGGSGAMGNAPTEPVSAPAAQHDVYADPPLVLPMATASGAPVRTSSATAPGTTATPEPHPTSTPTVLPEDQTPSPEPSPTEPEPTANPSATTPG